VSLYAGIKTAISANVTGYTSKVYPLIAPEGTATPYATYQHLNTFRYKDLIEYLDNGYSDYQLNFFDTSYVTLQTAYEQWITYIKNYRSTLGGVTIQNVEILYEQDGNEFVGDVVRYKKIIDIRFHY
jgi:hypothetical protein